MTEQVETQQRRKVSVEIAGAAVFIALSAVVSALTTGNLPRVPGWQIAILDPISAVWIVCFLIFGWRAGCLCFGAGTAFLFIFDPSTPIGPMFKLLATLPFMVIPTMFYLVAKARNSECPSCPRWLLDRKHYTITMLIAWPVRLALMLFFNFLLFSTIWAGWEQGLNLGFLGLPEIRAWEALTIAVLLINSWQTAFDIIVPYLLTFKLVERGIFL